MTGAAENHSARFAAPPAGSLRVEPLDEMTLIYNRASGQTHIVAAPVPEILEVLDGSPATIAMLLERLADRFDLGDPDPEALVARLDELADAGIVIRA